MIQIKNAAQIALMREAGRITGEALVLAGEAVREGVSTKHLDDIIHADKLILTCFRHTVEGNTYLHTQC